MQMTFKEEQEIKAIELLKRDVAQRKHHREYMREYRQKLRDQGIKQPSSFSKNNTANLHALWYIIILSKHQMSTCQSGQMLMRRCLYK